MCGFRAGNVERKIGQELGVLGQRGVCCRAPALVRLTRGIITLQRQPRVTLSGTTQLGFGKLNGGGSRLDLSTSNGNVRLMKK